jgi:LacI family transcriptional regulator
MGSGVAFGTETGHRHPAMASTTIIDVAKQAGVSIKTVSRVINNIKTVRPQIRERVQRAIEKLDYHPNPSARGLGGNRSYLLGLLYDVSCGYYATSVLAGATERSRAAKYQIVMLSCDYNAESLAEDVSRSVRQSRVDGVILTPPLSDLSAVTAAIESLRIPFVKIAPGKHDDTYRSVCTNDRLSCAGMTEQLAALGHQRIGFIIGNPDHAAVMDRYRGYLDGLESCGLKLDKSLVVQGYNSHASGVQSARKLLNVASPKRPTAIFASNDEMAAGVLTVAHSMGLGVPEDISIVGFDDAPLASQVWPALTTIRQPIQDMAAEAAHLLLSTLGGEPADDAMRVLPSSLMFRQSTGPAPNRTRHQRVRPESGRAGGHSSSSKK